MKLFISYSREDLTQVQVLVTLLREGAHDPWFDQKLLVGQDWKEKLGQAIDDCEAFVYALSLNSVDSEWCQWEFARAVRKGKPIIPVRVSENLALEALPPALKGKHVAEFTENNSTNVARLMGGLNHLTVSIAPEDAPQVSEYPQGRPALADPMMDTGKIQVTFTRHHPSSPDELEDFDSDTEVVTAQVGLPRRYNMIIMLIVSIIILIAIFGALSLFPVGCEYGIDFACPSDTQTPTASITSTVTPTPTTTHTPTITHTPTATVTASITSTSSLTPTYTAIPTQTSVAEGNLAVQPTVCEAEILEQIVIDETEDETILVSFNSWLNCSDFPELIINTALNNMAGRQRSYLNSLGQNQLNNINPYIDSQGRDIDEQALVVGYEGFVEMLVILQTNPVSFADIIEVSRSRGIEIERYTEIGIDVDYDRAVNLYYVVIAIGLPNSD